MSGTPAQLHADITRGLRGAVAGLAYRNGVTVAGMQNALIVEALKARGVYASSLTGTVLGLGEDARIDGFVYHGQKPSVRRKLYPSSALMAFTNGTVTTLDGIMETE